MPCRSPPAHRQRNCRKRAGTPHPPDVADRGDLGASAHEVVCSSQCRISPVFGAMGLTAGKLGHFQAGYPRTLPPCMRSTPQRSMCVCAQEGHSVDQRAVDIIAHRGRQVQASIFACGLSQLRAPKALCIFCATVCRRIRAIVFSCRTSAPECPMVFLRPEV